MTRITASLALLASTALLAACGSNDDNNGGTATAAGGAGGGSAAAVPINLGGFALDPVRAGRLKGYFKDIALKTSDIESGPVGVSLLQSGTYQGLSNIASLPVAIGATKGVDFKIVWNPSNGDGQKLLVKDDIKTAADLKGKKIGVPLGTSADEALGAYLDKNGLSRSDVHVIDTPGPAMVAAFKRGSVDGVYIWYPVADGIEKAGAHALDTTYPLGFTVFSTKFVQEHEDVVQRYVCDIARFQKAYTADPAAAYPQLAEDAKLDVATTSVIQKNNKPSPADQSQTLGSDEQVQTIVDSTEFLKSSGQAPAAQSPEQVKALFDSRFAQKAASGGCGER